MNIEEQKRKLVSELETIEKDLQAFGRELNEEGNWVPKVNLAKEDRLDPLDDANLTEEVLDDIAGMKVLEERHQQVKRALRAIEGGELWCV